jgi:hypothetical protein
MDRWTWMALRLYAPAAAGAVVTVLALIPLSGLADGPLGLAFQPVLRLGTLAGAVATMALFAIASIRLLRWIDGEGLLCECGGLLGRERPGIRGRTDYRRCLACNRAVSSRHYE